MVAVAVEGLELVVVVSVVGVEVVAEAVEVVELVVVVVVVGVEVGSAASSRSMENECEG